jgi:GNAT superfamily N-acetyltransferase
MVCDTPAPGDVRLPGAYRLELSTRDAISAVRILTGTGALAASGYAAECAGAFVYDRIVTEEAHRRLGLGRAVMIALASTRRSQAAQEVLVATQAGRALYATLGWTVRAPYTTAIIPE